MEKKYVYKSGHSKNIDALQAVLGEYRHAALLDMLVFKSTNSSIPLPGQDIPDRWITGFYNHTCKKIGYSRDYLTRLISKFVKMGLVERKKKIVKNKCQSCIRVTEKTLAILNLVDNQPKNDMEYTEKTSKSLVLRAKNNSRPEIKTGAYKEERHYVKEINIITRSKREQQQPYNLPGDIQALFDRVGERLTTEQKAIIFASFKNLQSQTNAKISSPKDFIAWICFSILNAKHQLPGKNTFQAQLNTLMKIARSPGGLKKPRGFHNHWDIGQEMRKKEQKVESENAKSKERIDTRKNRTLSFGDLMPIKAKDVWDKSSALNELKSKRAEVLRDLSSLISEGRAIPMLYQSSPDFLDKQLKHNQFMIGKKREVLKAIEKDISTEKSSQEEIKNLQWEGLYEAG